MWVKVPGRVGLSFARSYDGVVPPIFVEERYGASM